MDLSFRLPDPAAASALPAADLALLVAMLADRQAASATAQAQAGLGGSVDVPANAPLAPLDGTFNAAMAARITEWQWP